VVIARGKHLFPFRTEPLSPSAPMVLGPQGPGRVGRRRFYVANGPVYALRRRGFCVAWVCWDAGGSGRPVGRRDAWLGARVLAGAGDRDRRQRDAQTSAPRLLTRGVAAQRHEVTRAAVGTGVTRHSCGERAARSSAGGTGRGRASRARSQYPTKRAASHPTLSRARKRRPRRVPPGKRRRGGLTPIGPGVNGRLRPAGRWSAAASLWGWSPRPCRPPCG